VSAAHTSLLANYRGVICDLDGVVYRGSKAVPGAIAALNSVVADVPVAFATNNASRPPTEVSHHLRRLGLEDAAWSVVTSAQAAAAYLAGRLSSGTPVLAVGGPGVAAALTEVGLTPIGVTDLSGTTTVEAVVQGAGQDVSWRELAEVGYLAQAGATWVATNLDATIPTSRGQAPGNGALVSTVRTTTVAVPHVTGKPDAALFDFARSRLGTEQDATIVVGDRLETDIAGARSAGLDSMFVLGGSSTLRDLAFADEDTRPTYFAFGLCGLLEPGLCRQEQTDGIADVTPSGELAVPRAVEPHRLLQAVITVAWDALDHGRAVLDDEAMWTDLERRMGVIHP
jgi:HAD superfamily hydrolase (TIGR01450 family)